MDRLACLAGTALLLLANAALAQTSQPAGAPANGAHVISPAVPVAPGSMYNGNNTTPPKLTLTGPLAPATLALEPSASFPTESGNAPQQTNANPGGSPGSARAGGGN